MRIAVDVEEQRLRAVTDHAAEEGMTLKAAFERALREFLANPATSTADAPAMENGGEWVALDRGFSIYPGLRPLR